MKYEAIIFDVSDTLIEYSPNYVQIYGDRLRYLGFQVTEEKAIEISRAINMEISMQAKREQEGEPKLMEEELNKRLDATALSCIMSENIDECLKKLESIKLPKQEMKVIQGTFEVLDALRESYRLAIVSNHYSWLMEHLKELGLSSYFETIIISENVGVAKPNVKIMQIALQELSLEAKQCLYIGDQPFDVLCSKEAGMDCAWIATDEMKLPDYFTYQEDFRIHRLNDLIKILC